MKTTYVRSSLSVILSLIIVVATFVQPVHAIYDDDSRIYSEIEAALLRIAPEKEFYGLGEVNFSTLSIGRDIPAYEVIDSELKQISMRFYPILDETATPVALATVAFVDGQICISISHDFVDTLCSLNENDAVSLIYDKSGVNLLRNGHLLNLQNDQSIAELGRDSITSLDKQDFLYVNQTSLYSIAEIASIPPAQTIGYDDDSVYLQVPIVRQSNDWTCWAAGAACILQYKGLVDNNFTDLDFADEFTSYMGETLETVDSSVNKVLPYMNKQYLKKIKSEYDYYSIIDAYTNTWTSLSHDNPVYGHFNYSSSGAHLMIIRGIYDSVSFSVMDPLSDYYRTGTIVKKNANNEPYSKRSYRLVIPSATSASTLELATYGYRI